MSTSQNKAQTNMQKSLLQKSVVPIAAIIILLFLVALLAGAFNDKVAPAIITKSDNQLSLDSKNTFEVTLTTSKIFEPVAASVTAKQATIISSRILARIDKINVRAGDTVKKGDLLIQLEKNDLTAQVLQAKEKVKAVEARHNEAKQNYARTKELFDRKLVSAFNLDKSKADFQAIVADVTAAKQALKQAETTLNYATLRSPINGRVVDRFAEPGNTAQPGNKLLSLYNPLSLRVEAQVREQLALTLHQGQSIQVELPALKELAQGEIDEIVPAANTGSRSFLIKASIHYNENLLPGMYARLMVPAGEEQQLLVPTAKVGHVGQLNFVWVNVDGEKQRRFVRLGKENTLGMVTVVSGLSKGEKILDIPHK